MLGEEHLTKFKSELLDRQSKLINQVQDRFGLSQSQTDSVGELSSYDNHPGDMATELYERGKDLVLNEHAEAELAKINEALHAINEGTYGICRVCSMNISIDRLKANPVADTCREHADNTIFENDRPIEEDVYSSHINPDGVGLEKEVGYDAEDTWQEVGRYGTSETPSDFYGDKASYDDMYPNSDEDIGIVEDIEKHSSDYLN